MIATHTDAGDVGEVSDDPAKPDPATPSGPLSDEPTDPETPPLYPPSPASAMARAWRRDYLQGRVPPTLPRNNPLWTPPDAAAKGRASGPGTTAVSDDPEADLRMYPQTINAEYLEPMTKVIDDALASGDFTALEAYASNIAQEQGVGLAKKAYAARGELTPAATVITAIPGTDNSPADGTTANTVDFEVKDQYGAPMAAAVTVTCDMATATPTPGSGTSDATTGMLSVSVVDTVAEVVSVTATAGSATASASLTFAEVVPPEDDPPQGQRGQS